PVGVAAIPSCITWVCYMLEGACRLPAIAHCFRRDAVYYWRRWTPGPRRALLQLGLAVKDPRTARRLSSLLTARSEELFPLWTAGQMNKSQLLDYLHRCLA